MASSDVPKESEDFLRGFLSSRLQKQEGGTTPPAEGRERILEEGTELGTLTPVDIEKKMKGSGKESDERGVRGKHKIEALSTNELEMKKLCLRLIGSGDTFCLRAGCTTNHRMKNKADVKAGDVVIAKTAVIAYCDPITNCHDVGSEVLEEWKNLSTTFDDWNSKFLAVNNSTKVLSSAELRGIEFKARKAKAIQTPSKAPVGAVGVHPLDVSPYKKTIFDPYGEVEGGVRVLEPEEITRALVNIENELETNSDLLVRAFDQVQQQGHEAGENFEVLFEKVNSTLSTIGKRPALSQEFDGPTIFAIAANMATTVKEIGLQCISFVTKTDLARTEAGLQQQVITTVDNLKKTSIEPQDIKLSRVDAVLRQALTICRDNINYEAARVTALEAQLSALGLSSNVTPPGPNNTAALEAKIDDIKREVRSIASKNDASAVKSFGLGFKKLADAQAYIMKELPSSSYGLIVDAHVVFEHIFVQISPKPILDNMYKMHKIKIDNINDGLAVQSFESAMPKFFTKQGEYKVVSGNCSYFSAIKSWSEWVEPNSGYRDMMRTLLNSFKESHLNSINEALLPGSVMHSLAVAALTTSVAWVEAFIAFLDMKYAELHTAKFGTGPAWSLTTRLGQRILSDVFIPRSGILGTLTAGGNSAIAPKVFWAIVRSHDVMEEFKSMNFMDHPSIASEFVKFLTINTGLEAVDKLELKVAALEETAKGLVKELKAATTAASSASNKADEAKRLAIALEKRVVKLEAKK
jgi:hypothetical protein